MKRVLSLLLALTLLAASLAGCGAQQDAAAPDGSQPVEPDQQGDSPEEPDAAPQETPDAQEPEEPSAGPDAVNPSDAATAPPQPEMAEPEQEVTLYLPDDLAMGFEQVTVTVEGSPQSIIDALILHCALPKGTVVNHYKRDDSGGEAVITLDLSPEFRDALAATGTAGETMLLGSLVNTMLEARDAGSLILTCDGSPIETGHNVYDFPLTFFQLYAAK